MSTSITLDAMPFDAVATTVEGVTTYDRTTYAADVARYLNSILSSGIIAPPNEEATEQFKVTAGDGMISLISAGAANLLGRICWIDTSNNALTHTVGGSNPRIDRIVLCLRTVQDYRSITLEILAGTAAASPVAPELTRNEDVYMISLAQRLIAANSSVGGAITDERYNDTVCGFAKTSDIVSFDNENNLLKYNRSVISTDTYGMPTEVHYTRPSDSSLALKIVYSNPNSDAQYQTITESYYKTNGSTIYKTIVYTLTYLSTGCINTMSRVVS